MDHPLKSLREASGCSQVEICRRTGISPTRLSLAENFLTGLTGETARNTHTIVKNIAGLIISCLLSSPVSRRVGPRNEELCF